MLPSRSIPTFNRWMLADRTPPLDCARVLANDVDYIAQEAKRRIQYTDPPELDMHCARGIRWRNYFPEQKDVWEGNNRLEEGGDDVEPALNDDYPLAQARVVYKDYVFLEMELAAAYSPHNWYCYAIDRKADPTFRARMHALAQCVPNVLIGTVAQEWDVDSQGHNMNAAHLACLELLLQPERRWNYVALLQNHDSAIKTNRQAIQIHKWLHGANDVEITHVPTGRVDEQLDWSFEALHLFKNGMHIFLIFIFFAKKIAKN